MAAPPAYQAAADQAKDQDAANQRLLHLCLLGDVPAVARMIAAGCDPAAKDDNANTTLHIAASKGHVEVIKFLTSRGLELDVDNKAGRTPLHLAALYDHAPAVALLASKGAWMESTDCGDETPLLLAARQATAQTVRTLCEAGANANAVSRAGMTPLAEAALRDDEKMMEALCDAKARVQGTRVGGASLLHFAAACGGVRACRLLRARGLELEDTDNDDRATPLHAAARAGRGGAVQALLDAGADPNAEDIDGHTALDHLPQSAFDAEPDAETADEAEIFRAREARAAAVALRKRKAVHGSGESERAERDAARADEKAAKAAEAKGDKDAADEAKWQKELALVLEAFRSDDEFQADFQRPHVRTAIEAVRADYREVAHHQNDPVVMRTLNKMRKLQEFCRLRGRKVSMHQLLREGDALEPAVATPAAGRMPAGVGASPPAGQEKERHEQLEAPTAEGAAASPESNVERDSGGAEKARAAGGGGGGGDGAKQGVAAKPKSVPVREQTGIMAEMKRIGIDLAYVCVRQFVMATVVVAVAVAFGLIDTPPLFRKILGVLPDPAIEEGKEGLREQAALGGERESVPPPPPPNGELGEWDGGVDGSLDL